MALASFSSPAQDGSPPDIAPELRERNLRTVERRFAERKRAFENDAARMVRRGLIADAEKREVRIQAELTGLDADTPIEFVLISDSSGHDYEAVAVSFARPGDIHEALEFIGLPAGLPVSPPDARFWPRGRRVEARVRFDRAGGDGTATEVGAETLVVDARTGEPLPGKGWVFTGSRRLPPESPEGEPRYAADVRDPGSILSIYNEPDSVLDIPDRIVKSDVYGFQTPNPAIPIPPGLPCEFILTPRGGAPVDFDLAVRPAPDGDDATEPRLELRRGGEIAVSGRPPEIYEELETWSDKGRDPFVRIVPDPGVPVGALASFIRDFDRRIVELGVRVQAPREGDIFYQAFLPNESALNRKNRPSQPWELFIEPRDGSPVGILKSVREDWPESGSEPDITVREVGSGGPEKIRDLVLRGNHRLPVLLVFCPGDLAYGRLLEFLIPLQEPLPIVYVVPDRKPGPE